MTRVLKIISVLMLIAVAVYSPAVANGNSQGYTSITECGVITEPGKYRLMNDLEACALETGSPIFAGVAISANDVVLDLNGHAISCAGGGFFNFGVLVSTYASQVDVKNGAVSSCDVGVVMVVNTYAEVRDLMISGNGVGIRVYGGANNKIFRNEITRNFGDGIFMDAFDVPGAYVGSTNHIVRKNLISNNGGFGISTNSTENSLFACNRVDGNSVGIGLSWFATGNTVKNNVAHYNFDVGISAFGVKWASEILQPVAQGNTFKHNSAMSNGRVDLSEVFVDLATPDLDLSTGPECLNTWTKNQFGLAIGPTDCIGTTQVFDDHGCAPGYEEDGEVESDD